MDKEWRTKGKLRLYPHRLSSHFPSCGEIHTYHFPFHTYPHHLSIVYILQFLLNISTIYRLFHFSHIIYYYSYLFSFLYIKREIYINKKKDPLSSPCKGEARYEPPSYPPWGKIDYALRLRFFLSFILAFLPSSREVSVSSLPLTGG